MTAYLPSADPMVAEDPLSQQPTLDDHLRGCTSAAKDQADSLEVALFDYNLQAFTGPVQAGRIVQGPRPDRLWNGAQVRSTGSRPSTASTATRNELREMAARRMEGKA